MKIALTLFIGLMSASVAFACECLPLTFEQEVQSSSSIFRGRVVSVDHYVFDIEIIHVWKGGFESKTFRLIQGETSCEKRTFELHKEYLFYLKGKSVFNCSRTEEYQLTMDSELLDLKFRNIGDKASIESNSLTDREIDVLKWLLSNRDANPNDMRSKQVLFAIRDMWVDKWTFFDSCRRSDQEIRLIKPKADKNSGSMILWIGDNWDKSFKKLKKGM